MGTADIARASVREGKESLEERWRVSGSGERDCAIASGARGAWTSGRLVLQLVSVVTPQRGRARILLCGSLRLRGGGGVWSVERRALGGWAERSADEAALAPPLHFHTRASTHSLRHSLHTQQQAHSRAKQPHTRSRAKRQRAQRERNQNVFSLPNLRETHSATTGCRARTRALTTFPSASSRM